jgi:hypothetical protein
MKQRAKDRIKPVIENRSEGQNGQHEAKKQEGSLFHKIVSREVFTSTSRPLARRIFPRFLVIPSACRAEAERRREVAWQTVALLGLR